ncbi:tryptophan halogenase family protein [Asticcacaulis sp. AND118]|uniref:tryptophan halogenase family protein n=1 Tax=Asticcacaulis sp. AND118 TaxID=2840468 RepID=UPI001CFF5AE5|nr:tryptophan halogenase family protein [Asticcacaulis sp. AND118]UDF05510.1 tryptophan 7-halogenase [Asticcacaulis sp. AND118]
MAPIRNITILGGGTSGWMAAAVLVRAFKPGLCTVRLIESEDIGIVGVGEATLPQVRDFNTFLGLDEPEFMRATNATFKLGIEFRGWGMSGSYHHPFGVHGQSAGGIPFHQLWLRARTFMDPGPIEDYSFPIRLARESRFDFPIEDPKSIRSTYAYAYHFDAVLYARYLRQWCEARGVQRIEGKVTGVNQNPETGFVETLTLENGETVGGDLFIDCSGFRAVIAGQTLNSGWEDWTPWLPCDRALAVPTERTEDLTPYTRATAREAGWTWRIPLQHRTGNGYVFSSRFTTEDRAREVLLGALDARAQAEPRLLRFQAGRRTASWTKNVIALGLASGFLEPLESTSIYLSQIALTFLMRLMPDARFDPALADEFNRLIDIEYERVRDFLILHYHANTGSSGPLWDYVRSMDVPDSLKAKMEMFRHRGHVPHYKDGLFSPASWIAVFMGQDVTPQAYDRQADALSQEALTRYLKDLKRKIDTNLAVLPSHADFVAGHCFDPKAAEAAHV